MMMRKLIHNKMKSQKGFTMVEVVVTMIVIAIGLLLLFNVFGMAVRQATQSRNWLVAEMIADGMLEEIKAHPYGDPMPSSWLEPQVTTVVVQGRANRTSFEKKIETSKKGDPNNSSFFNRNVKGDYEFLTLTITWTEGSGVEGKGVTKSYKEAIWVRRER